MTQFLRNMAVACLGLMALVGMMTAGLFISLFLLAAGIVFWGYFALRRAGIINTPRGRHGAPPYEKEMQVIEADYVVIQETEQRLPEDKA